MKMSELKMRRCRRGRVKINQGAVEGEHEDRRKLLVMPWPQVATPKDESAIWWALYFLDGVKNAELAFGPSPKM
jgi:hypothetical protein